MRIPGTKEAGKFLGMTLSESRWLIIGVWLVALIIFLLVFVG